MYTAIPGIPAIIETYSFAAIERFGKPAMLRAVASGGIYCASLPEDPMSMVPTDVRKLMTSKEVAICGLMGGGDVIQFIREIQESLSEEDKKAIFLHEAGHLHHKHLKAENLAEKLNSDGLLDDCESELEADAFAVKVVGKRAMRQAIIHAVENLAKAVATKVGEVPFRQDVYAQVVSHYLFTPTMRARFAALQ